MSPAKKEPDGISEWDETRLLCEVIRQTDNAILITDAQERIVYVNPAFERLYGYSHAELKGKTPRMIKSGIHSAQFYARMWETILAGRAWQGSLINRRKDGTLIRVIQTITPIYDAHGRIHFFSSIQHNIIKWVQREQRDRTVILQIIAAMRQANNRRELAAIVAGHILTLLDMNAAAVCLFRDHVSRSTLDSTVELEIVYADGVWAHWQECPPKNKALLLQILRDGKKPQIIQPIQNSDDWKDAAPWNGIHALACIPLSIGESLFGVLWVGSHRAIDEGQLNILISLAEIIASAIQRQTLHEDLQAQMQALQAAQEQLIQAGKLAAVGTLVAGIAHELNNPLTSLLLYAQMALDKVEDPQLRHDLQQIELLAIRTAKVVRSLLDFARNDPGTRKPVHLQPLINSVLTLVENPVRLHNATVSVDLEDALPPILANENQMQQVFINLLINALQATQDYAASPEIHITARQEHTTELSTPHCVHIIVQDNGTGIPVDVMPRIFDPFFTTKPTGEGTGLGLSIVHGIINGHGGKIWAESEPGRGARFHILLPVSSGEDHPQPQSPQRIQEPAAQASLAHGERILIIDDEFNIRHVFERILQRQGYQVHTAVSGREALEYIRTTSYDLILCDIQMPDMNGMQLYATLQQQHPNLLPRIVFISGDTVDAHTRQFLQEVSSPVLHKPFSVEQLVSEVARYLSANQPPHIPDEHD